MAGQILNSDQVAKLLGRSITTVRAWLSRGLPATRSESGARQYQIDAGVLVDWLIAEALKAAPAARQAPASPDDGDQSGGTDTDEAKRRKEWALARKAELEYAIASGEVAVIADIVKPFLDGMASMRAKLLSIPGKLAPILTAETNVMVARNLLEAELREARPACGVEVPLEQNWSRRPNWVRPRPPEAFLAV
jgi:phage terminase Nu1 subunit (DNA packaging protein)